MCKYWPEDRLVDPEANTPQLTLQVPSEKATDLFPELYCADLEHAFHFVVSYIGSVHKATQAEESENRLSADDQHEQPKMALLALSEAPNHVHASYVEYLNQYVEYFGSTPGSRQFLAGSVSIVKH